MCPQKKTVVHGVLPSRKANCFLFFYYTIPQKKKITQGIYDYSQRLSIVSYLLFLVPSNVTISQSYYSIKKEGSHITTPFTRKQ